MKKLKQKNFMCPFCKTKNFTIIQWQESSTEWEVNIATNQFSELRSEGGDIISWNCPYCEHELSRELVRKLGLE